MRDKQILIKSSNDEKRAEIIFPTEYRNKNWSSQFGKVQFLLRNYKKVINDLIFDITNCTWIDPLPFLSLMLSINEIKDSIKNIYLKIPDLSRLNDGNKRVLYFLKSEGFFEELFKAKVKVICNPDFLISKKDLYNNIEPFAVLLYFQDSVILPAQIINLFDIKGGNNIVEFVEEKLKSCEHKLKNKISNYSYKSTFTSLSLYLTECLTNILEHAYPESNTKYAGLLIRYRIGMTDTSISSAQKQKLRQALISEHNNSYRLSKEFPESVSGFFEVFMIDAGIGLSRSFLGEEKFDKYTDPFRAAWEESIGQGRRNPFKKEKTTKFGGLYIIGQLLKDSYLCARDETEWIGENLPIKLESGANEKISETKIHIAGLSLILRLSWKKSSIYLKNWISGNRIYKMFNDFNSVKKHHPFLRGTMSSVDIYKKYYNKKYNSFKKGNPMYIKDERLGEEKDDFTLFFKDVMPKNYLENRDAQNFILYLTVPGQSKSQITTKIINGFSLIDNPSKTIIIADIPDYEAALYEYSLADAKYDTIFYHEFDKIILITRSLSVLVLSKLELVHPEIFTYKVDEDATISYIHPPEDYSTFSPHLCLEHVIEWLKTHDSMFYWLTITRNSNKKDYIMNGDIKWYKHLEETTITNYFHFSQTLSDEILLILYDILLNRCLSLGDDTGLTFIAMDNLTSRLANTANSKYDRYSQDGVKIFLGSVYVTGVLEENSLYNIGRNSNHHLVHFLYNSTINSKTKEIRSAMLLWPTVEFLNLFNKVPVMNHRRVGQTSTIAPYGWKYYTIPRYAHIDPEFKNIPIHELDTSNLTEESVESNTICPPPETYRAWQNNEIVYMGHYEYSTYHDLFKIDTLYAFDESWQLKESLSLFFITEIMSALGVPVESLKTKDNILKGKITTYSNENNITLSKKENSPLVVYPAHYALDIIIQKIKRLLPDTVVNKVIPLVSITNNRSSIAFLPSPQSLEFIRKKVVEYKKNHKTSKCTILFLDTVRINGNTEKQIKHILTLLGVTEVNTLILLDRQLIPLHRGNKISDKIYWKLDLPVFGHKNSCPLCRGLERLEVLKNLLVVDILTERIVEYSKIWGKIDRYANFIEKHGIKKSQKIVLKNKEKKYGIFIDKDGNTKQLGGNKNKITLTTSVGLSIYCAELHSMTCRDNMILEIIKNESTSEETKIELIASNLLLFNYQFPYYTLKELVKILLTTTKNITSPNNHTALAALTLIACERIPVDLIISCIKEEAESFLDVKNIDILIYLCYCSNNIIYERIKNLPEIKRCLKGYKDLSDLNKQFHQELYNDYGKDHNTPLFLTAVELTFEKLIFEQSYSSICKIRYLFNEYDISDFKNIKTLYELEKIEKDLDLHINVLRDVVNKYTPLEESIFNSEIEIIQKKTHPHFLFLRNEFIKIHQNLFISFDTEKDSFSLKDDLINLIDLIDPIKTYNRSIGISKLFNKPKIPTNSNIKERWVIWDKAVLTEIEYLLRNCIHVNESDQMPDPYGDATDQQIVNQMWLSTNYTQTHLEINFINLSQKEASEVESISATKFRYEKVRIKKLGGHFGYSNNAYFRRMGEETEKALIATISLPFI